MASPNEIKGKIILLGASKVGKTSILTRYIDDKFSTNVQSTMGIDYRTKRESYPDYSVRLDIWDTAGQEKFKTINKSYYKNAIGAFIIFDLTNMESFEEIHYYLRETKLHSDKSEKEKFIRILFGNKYDMVKQNENARQVMQSDIDEKIKEINGENPENPILYFEGSALDKTNIKESFEVFLTFLKEKYVNETKKTDANGVSFKLDTKKEENGGETNQKKKCC